MRKLILVEDDVIVRNFIASGAVDSLEDDETFWVARSEVEETELLEARGERYLGPIEQPPERARHYHDVRQMNLTSYRRRMRSQRMRLAEYGFGKRTGWKLRALPGVRQLLTRRAYAATGLHPQLHPLMRELAPDVVIVPSDGIGSLAADAYRSARELGIPSVAVVYGWDHLDYKGGYSIRPDHVAVPGEQAVELATRYHRFRPQQVTAIGAPQVDGHVHYEHGSEPSPFPFRYALFAGASFRFDELEACRMLDDAIERERLDLKVVYRPHPYRFRRKRPDYVRDEDFRHVVVDPQVRPDYSASFESGGSGGVDEGSVLPPLDYYPALIDNAEFVLSPYSTMMIEAGLYDRRVLIVSYDDGVHDEFKLSQIVADYDFMEGLDRIEGFRLCTDCDRFTADFVEMARAGEVARGALREQMKFYFHFDERPYGERLLELVERVAGRAGEPAAAA